MSQLNSAMFANRNRAERYVDFDEMEYTPEIASSLDIYADEMTTHSALQPMLNISALMKKFLIFFRIYITRF